MIISGLSKGKAAVASALLAMVILVAMFIWGCGSSSYDDLNADPSLTTNTGVIIDAAKLKEWMDQGKLNAPLGTRDRVVLLSATSMKNYTSSVVGQKLRIPGAQLITSDSDLYKTRREALTDVSEMVPDGPQMDAVVKKLGIDGNTTIVFTTPKSVGSPTHMSRAYFTFRYWGFPKNRLKILNGGDDAWNVQVVANGYPALTTNNPITTPSTFSLTKNGQIKGVIRYSLSDMLLLVDRLNLNSSLLNEWQIVEARGVTTSAFMANSLRQSATAFMQRVAGGTTNYMFPDRNTLIESFKTVTLRTPEGTDTAYLLPSKRSVFACGSGTSASPYFVMFDAILDVPEGQAIIYDGSSIQWGSYRSANILATTNSDVAAIWGTDINSPGTALNRSVGTYTGSQYVDPVWASVLTSVSDSRANQIEEADQYYMNSGNKSTGGSSSGDAGGGC